MRLSGLIGALQKMIADKKNPLHYPPFENMSPYAASFQFLGAALSEPQPRLLRSSSRKMRSIHPGIQCASPSES
jgi:hypothetical protein